jgi:hypothetical protein
MPDTIRDFELLIQVHAETQRQLVEGMRAVSDGLVASAITVLTEGSDFHERLVARAFVAGAAAIAHDAAIRDATTQLRQVVLLEGQDQTLRGDEAITALLFLSAQIRLVPYETVIATRQAIRDGRGNAMLFRAACRAAAVHRQVWEAVETVRKALVKEAKEAKQNKGGCP